MPTHKRITNQDVIARGQASLSDDVILSKIRETNAKARDAVYFNTSVDGMKTLKAANFPDSAILFRLP